MPKFSRLLIAVALLSVGYVHSASAADGDTAYIMSYFETHFADKDKVRALARKLSDTSNKEDSNLRFEVLQRIDQADQLSILAAWKDKTATAAHADAAHTKEFRETLPPMRGSLYDERFYRPIN